MGLRKYFVKKKERESIEAEEIFLDAEAIRSIEEKGKMEKPIKKRNFIFFYIFIIFCFLILLFRTGYLQVNKGDYYYNLAQGNRLRIYPIVSPRGLIYDSLLNPLVYNMPNFDLLAYPIDFLDNPDSVQEEILTKISQILNEKDSFKDILKKRIEQAQGQRAQITLVSNLDRETALILESMVNEWSGIRIDTNTQRKYIYPSLSHLLGYTGQVSSLDLEINPDYLLNDQIGKEGLESQYEGTLRGESGQQQIEVNSLGKTQNILGTKIAQPGNSLILFINHQLQEKLSQSLEKMLSKLKVRKAVGIIMDPNNGGILAMVSLPNFDNNLFAQGISREDLEKLEDDPSKPFLNRAIAGLYPSGSTIKPLIASAALEEKTVNPFQRIDCQGIISIVNQYNPDIVYHFPDWKAHGATDMIKAIAQSCNVYFYSLGGGYGRIEGLGIERIKKYLKYFGLGSLTGIDLPGEEEGLIPDKEWKEQRGESWGLGDTYHVAIGQGDMMVTPLQMTSAIASIANNGILYQPQIVDKIIDSSKDIIEDIPEKKIRNSFIEKENIEIVKQGMREAVLSGSASLLSSLPVEVAGKTGTAQFGNNKTHAWFVGFAPYDNPQLVITILVEGGGEGYEAAVPVAKEVLEWYFRKDNN